MKEKILSSFSANMCLFIYVGLPIIFAVYYATSAFFEAAFGSGRIPIIDDIVAFIFLSSPWVWGPLLVLIIFGPIFFGLIGMRDIQKEFQIKWYLTLSFFGTFFAFCWFLVSSFNEDYGNWAIFFLLPLLLATAFNIYKFKNLSRGLAYTIGQFWMPFVLLIIIAVARKFWDSLK